MKKTLIALAILATSSLNIAIAAKGDICTNCPDLSPIKDASKFVDGDYYTKSFNAINSNLATFRAALIDDISAGQKQLSYSEVWTALTHTDEDPTNSNDIILLYRGDSIPKNHNAKMFLSQSLTITGIESTFGPKAMVFQIQISVVIQIYITYVLQIKL
ncbi:hypothetical protein ACPSKX_00555 [Moritella viscosa]